MRRTVPVPVVAVHMCLQGVMEMGQALLLCCQARCHMGDTLGSNILIWAFGSTRIQSGDSGVTAAGGDSGCWVWGWVRQRGYLSESHLAESSKAFLFFIFLNLLWNNMKCLVNVIQIFVKSGLVCLHLTAASLCPFSELGKINPSERKILQWHVYFFHSLFSRLDGKAWGCQWGFNPNSLLPAGRWRYSPCHARVPHLVSQTLSAEVKDFTAVGAGGQGVPVCISIFQMSWVSFPDQSYALWFPSIWSYPAFTCWPGKLSPISTPTF